MKFKNMKKAVLDIILYLALSIAVGIPLAFVQDSLILQNIIMIFGNLLISLVILYRSKLNLKNEIISFKNNYKNYLENGLKNWFIGFILMYITNFIIVFFILKGIANNEELNREMISNYPYYAAFSLIFFAPIIEEILFRYNFKDLFNSKKAYILITGILFGLMHVVLNFTSASDFLYVIPYSILGLAFSTMYYDSKNIFTSMIIHSFHNTISLLLIVSSL